LGISAAYVAEILVTGLQATLWLTFVRLTATGVDWIDDPIAEPLKAWATLITVFVVGFAYALGTIIDRIADSLLSRYDKKDESKPLKENWSKVRLQMMAQDQELNKFLEYVRSRLRIVRATVLNLSLITVTVSIFLYTRTSTSCLGIIAVFIGGLVLTASSVFAWR
jgi:hypothetical protein